MRTPLIALTVAAASAALAAGLTVPAAQAATTIRTGRYAIGDSVMLGAKPNLASRGFVVNAAESRQFSAALPIIRIKLNNGTLPRNLIIALGTNGTIRRSDCTAIVKAAGPARRVFLVNTRVPRGWTAQNNITLATCADDRVFAASRVYLIDWYTYSKGHASWFYSDGLHLRPAGKTAYTTLLDATLDALGR